MNFGLAGVLTITPGRHVVWCSWTTELAFEICGLSRDPVDTERETSTTRGVKRQPKSRILRVRCIDSKIFDDGVVRSRTQSCIFLGHLPPSIVAISNRERQTPSMIYCCIPRRLFWRYHVLHTTRFHGLFAESRKAPIEYLKFWRDYRHWFHHMIFQAVIRNTEVNNTAIVKIAFKKYFHQHLRSQAKIIIFPFRNRCHYLSDSLRISKGIISCIMPNLQPAIIIN